MDETQYTEDSIETLDPREHVRLRRGMYIGDTSTPNQLLVEIFSNALDEHNIGHGDKIRVDIHDDGTVEVEDWGQGFPVGVERDDGKTVLEAAFSVLNTSGKFRDDGVYGGNSLGLNGQGGKLANFLSSFFEVITIQDGKMEHLHFRDGILTESKVVKNVSSKKSGTYIQYRPDPQFFGTGLTDAKFFRGFFEDMTCLCPDLTIMFNGEAVESSGMEDFLNRHITSNEEITSQRFYLRASENDFSVDLGLTFTDSAVSSIYAYVNYGYTDTGPHISAIKSCLTRVLNQWARDNGILKEKSAMYSSL